MNPDLPTPRVPAPDPARAADRPPAVDFDLRLSPGEWAGLLATLAGIALVSWLAVRWWGQDGHTTGFWLVMAALQFIAVVVFAFRHARLPSGRPINTLWRQLYLLYTLSRVQPVWLAMVVVVVWLGWQLVGAMRWMNRQALSLGDALAALGLTWASALGTLVSLWLMTLMLKLAVYLLRANVRWRDALLAVVLAAVSLGLCEWAMGFWPGAQASPVAIGVCLPPLLAGGWVLGRRARSLLGSPVGMLRGVVQLLAAVLLAGVLWALLLFLWVH